MPEGPEIRTDSDQLDFFISNRILNSVLLINDLFDNRCDGLAELQKDLPLQVEKVRAYGKKLIIILKGKNSSNPWYIIFGYGMTGRIGSTKQKHSHLEFRMNKSWIGFDTWFYSDNRRFGSFEASNDPDFLQEQLSQISKPIALGYQNEKGFESITEEEFTEAIKECGDSYLARRLMDQKSICSGIGNYLLSEIFFEAKLDPYVRCSELSQNQIQELWKASNKIMLLSYNNNGHSASDYVNVNGQTGNFSSHLKVYGKDGEYINGNLIYACKGAHGRTIFITKENGADTLNKCLDSDNEDESN